MSDRPNHYPSGRTTTGVKWKDQLSDLTDDWSEHQFVGSVTLDHRETGLPLYVLVAAGETQEDMERRLHQMLSHGLVECRSPCPLET